MTKRRGRPSKRKGQDEEEEEDFDEEEDLSKKKRGRKRAVQEKGKKAKVPTLKIKLGKRRKDSSVNLSVNF